MGAVRPERFSARALPPSILLSKRLHIDHGQWTDLVNMVLNTEDSNWEQGPLVVVCWIFHSLWLMTSLISHIIVTNKAPSHLTDTITMNQTPSHTHLEWEIIDLPDELWFDIMSYLHPPDLYSLGCTSHRFVPLLSHLFWHSRNLSTQLFNMCMVKKWMKFRSDTLKFSWGALTVDDFRSARLAGSMGFVNRGLVFSRPDSGWCIGEAFEEDGSWLGPSVVLVDHVVGERNKIEERNHPEGKTRSISTETLSSFQIEPILLGPPFFHWTYQLIATSPSLTRITLRHIKQRDSNQWRIIFRWLLEALRFHNVLETLTIDWCSGLDLETLLDFVSQLQSTLERLELMGPYSYSKSSSRHRHGGITLPRVKFIQARWKVWLGLVGEPMVQELGKRESRISVMQRRFPLLKYATIETRGGLNYIETWYVPIQSSYFNQ
ncbi:hypothetical protein BDN72DRAFT_843502 [Pluteus cervinus]|uniref:Uncharacterized protein n=1 Tax=Pluteus cervinus TaxID=181527 RepID=A0ACD3ANK9_9AGAR|nr:hypothetical protein BDN72DRAFT_843502 [Pluteus cervinus]